MKIIIDEIIMLDEEIEHFRQISLSTSIGNSNNKLLKRKTLEREIQHDRLITTRKNVDALLHHLQTDGCSQRQGG